MSASALPPPVPSPASSWLRASLALPPAAPPAWPPERIQQHTADLRQRLHAGAGAWPGQQGRIAQALGLSEADLLLAHADDPAGTRAQPLARQGLPTLRVRELQAAADELLQGLAALGPVDTLVGTEASQLCIRGPHPGPGWWRGPVRRGPSGGHGADRTASAVLESPGHWWRHALAVEARWPGQPSQHSVQCFDAQGTALHRVLLHEHSQVAAWHDLVERHGSRWRQPAGVLGAGEADPAPACEPLADGLASEVATASACEVLQRAAQVGLPLTLSVPASPLRLHRRGPVRQVRLDGAWLSASHDDFQWRLREDRIARAWVVRRIARGPGAQGLTHALLLLGGRGEPLAELRDDHGPGQGERCEWRQLLSTLAAEPAPAPSTPLPRWLRPA